MKTGDRVLVSFASNSIGVVDNMRAYGNTEQTISGVHYVKGEKSQLGVMFTLEGCETHGLPFWFLPEWLTPLVERAK